MSKPLLPVAIANTIHRVRGQKVILDADLAALYGVATKVLNQAAGRNRTRFPRDFMFRLTADEADPFGSRSRSQIVTLKRGTNLKYLPYASTEQGVAMLSSVSAIVEAIRRLVAPPEKGKREIGFHVRETPPRYGTRKNR